MKSKNKFNNPLNNILVLLLSICSVICSAQKKDDITYINKNQNSGSRITDNNDFKKLQYFAEKKDLTQTLPKIQTAVIEAKTQKNYDFLCKTLIEYQKLLSCFGFLNDSKIILGKIEKYNELVTQEDEKLINDIYIKIGTADLLELSQNSLVDRNKIIDIKRKAYQQVKMINDANPHKKSLEIYSCQSLIWSLISEDLDSAKQYLKETEKSSMIKSDSDYLIQDLVIRGAIANVSKDYHQAVKYILEAIRLSKLSKKPFYIYSVTPMISVSYGQLNKFEEATKYSWISKNLTDSINQVKNRPENVNFLMDINKLINDNDSYGGADFSIFDSSKNWVVGVFILIVGCIALYSRNLYVKKEKDKLTNNPTKDFDVQKPILTISTEDFDLSKRLLDLAQTDVRLFYTEFQKIYPDFYDHFKNKSPELTYHDLNFCSLLKMNLTIKEIALYTNSTLKSVESRKYRISKKLNLREQKDLYLELSKIS